MSIIKDIIEFNKIRKILKTVYEEYDIINKFNKLFHVEFKMSKHAVLYGILSPGDLPTEVIYSFNLNNMSPKDHIIRYIENNLYASHSYMQESGIFDLLKFNVEEIDGVRNLYLIQFTPVMLEDARDAWYKIYKNILWMGGGLLTSGVLYLILKTINVI